MKSKSRFPSKRRVTGRGSVTLFDRAPTQRAIFNRLYKSGIKGYDVSVLRLFDCAWTTDVEFPFRRKQQYVGSIVSMINKKIRPYGMEIRTGKERRSYRLYRL